MLTNDVVSFEQPGPDLSLVLKFKQPNMTVISAKTLASLIADTIPTISLSNIFRENFVCNCTWVHSNYIMRMLMFVIENT